MGTQFLENKVAELRQAVHSAARDSRGRVTPAAGAKIRSLLHQVELAESYVKTTSASQKGTLAPSRAQAAGGHVKVGPVFEVQDATTSTTSASASASAKEKTVSRSTGATRLREIMISQAAQPPVAAPVSLYPIQRTGSIQSDPTYQRLAALARDKQAQLTTAHAQQKKGLVK